MPLSGEGARLHGGRFNAKGIPALYTSLSIMTAIKESNQIGTLQPTTLVCYSADIEPILDATDQRCLDRYGLALEDLAADNWRSQMRDDGKSQTQRFAERLIAAGYVGLKVRSFARGAVNTDVNMVLWTWGPDLPTQLLLNDDEGRLS